MELIPNTCTHGAYRAIPLRRQAYKYAIYSGSSLQTQWLNKMFKGLRVWSWYQFVRGDRLPEGVLG